jgi:hypothetical protein
MKNTFKILGIIALVAIIGFTMTSCGKKGGTVEIKNETSASINAFVFVGNHSSDTALSNFLSTTDGLATAVATMKPIAAGATATWSFSEDETVTWYWLDNTGTGRRGTATLSGDNEVSINTTSTGYAFTLNP